MADLRRLPPGTLPPVVLKFDASSLPVCLITLKGEGMNETQLRDLGQYTVRNQVANVPGASVPQPFGGRYRQIMVYVDPLKLEAHQLSVDGCRSVGERIEPDPAGGRREDRAVRLQSLYEQPARTASMSINALPLKTVDGSSVLVGDVGKAEDGAQIQYQHRAGRWAAFGLSARAKAGRRCQHHRRRQRNQGRRRRACSMSRSRLSRRSSSTSRSSCKTAIENLLHEGAIGLILTGLMILVFLGNLRATGAVFLSIPLSALAAFMVLVVRRTIRSTR